MGDVIKGPTGHVKIYLLGDAATIRVGDQERTYQGGLDRWLLTALTLSGPEGITFSRVRRSIQRDKDATRQRISRLRQSSGLGDRIESLRGMGYSLDVSDIYVDVRAFLRLVETPSSDPRERQESLRQARSILTSGRLPEFSSEWLLPHPATYARFRAAEQKARSGGQRILIIDDMIGHDLAATLRLKDHLCEVATSYEEYRQFEPRLSDFDLAVIDRHLTRNNDQQGEEIARAIEQRIDAVPVVLMTYDVPDSLDLPSWVARYGFAGAVRKRGNSDTADLGALAEYITEVLRDGPNNRACNAIEKGMSDKRREAEKRLADRLPPDQTLVRKITEMKEHAAQVVESAQMNDLQQARKLQRSFIAQWIGGTY